jgi:hypothetical protein
VGTKWNKWYVHHQDRMEYYESQQAAIGAVNLIIPSYENGIWDRNESHLNIGYDQGEMVDDELFARHYSANVLIPASISRMFRIDIYAKNKEDWIFKYGSDLLQQSLRAGYDCNEGYLAERLLCDYPDFTLNKWEYKKVDTPSERCLYACEYYEYSYCSIDKEDYYITIDNYLGKYQLVKLIDPLAEIVRVKFPIAVVDSSVAVTDDKKEWILEYGSDLLQQSFMGGYDCNDRYLQEKIAYDYPGFEINEQNYPKVDSPNQICFDACLGYEDAYCSSNNNSYYITLDNFLGKYQLIKSIDGLVKVTEQNSASGLVINDLLGIKIKKDKTLTNSNFVVLAASLSTFLVGLFTILYVIYVIRSSI